MNLKMRAHVMLLLMLLFSLCTAGRSFATESSSVRRIIDKLNPEELQESLTKYIEVKLSRPRYFETSCQPERTDNPLYPSIPFKECTYNQFGLRGWVELAVIPPTMLAAWIANACASSSATTVCTARVADYMWQSNQYSYPIVGNIVEPASSAGGSGSGAINLIFLHGVTIPRPQGIPADTSMTFVDQKTKLKSLATSEQAYNGKASQVSRPAGIRREVYTQFGRLMEGIDVGVSCPDNPQNRKTAWLTVSRRGLIEAWNKPHHRLVDALAQALDAGTFPGVLRCP